VMRTRLDPRPAMAACLAQWREAIAGCDDTGLQDQVRETEPVSRMLHSVMLETVAELDSRNIAASAGFGTTKRLLAGMLHLSATEADTRLTHATRRSLNGEVLPPTLPSTAAALAAGKIGPAQVRVITEPIGRSYTTCHGQRTASQTRRNPAGGAATWCRRWGVGVGGSTGGGLLPGVECSG